MPIHWKLDSRKRLVTAVVEGACTRADVEAYLAAVDGGGAVTWRKLFDGRDGHAAMDPADMIALGVLMRGYHLKGPVGALAIVVPESQVEAIRRLLGILAAADRPMRVFHEIDKAQQWIERLPD